MEKIATFTDVLYSEWDTSYRTWNGQDKIESIFKMIYLSDKMILYYFH